ncbi:phosphotransferase [Branchiibius sp. NY16-3462-2]|uniref:phosphotransferase family protein n=1 Tax=Branchiibius sp. NY16-3462-2 TaxID=1807500 RepID=UPI0025BE23E8|nr:phosphotransferase [Branchiibius sp. NY16-3462-2]
MVDAGMLNGVKHGYTNWTEHSGGVVRKLYAGPDAEVRQAAEYRALTSLEDDFPVPQVVRQRPGELLTKFVGGEHGQDLMDAGRATAVLSACGRILRRLHDLDPRMLDPAAGDGVVVQHGDFGPNNLLFDVDDERVTAVLDWEFSGTGEAITDIAWCEWIIRMHHPDAVSQLPAFFQEYGWTPGWNARRAEMIRRCGWLEAFTERWEPGGEGATTWRNRTRIVEGWTE